MVDIIGLALIFLMGVVIIQYLAIPKEHSLDVKRNKPLIAAVISINVMSLLDSMSTLFLISNNYSKELNPIMDALIRKSFFLFIGTKLSLTLCATLFCWYYYERKKYAKRILKTTSQVYCALMAWHCILISSTLF